MRAYELSELGNSVNLKIINNLFNRYCQLFCFVIISLVLSSVYVDAQAYEVPLPPNMLEQRVELIEPEGELSLSEALTLALLHNPTLQEYAWGIRIADVNSIQAGLLPNPELAIEAENFLGSGQQKDFEQTETTVAISQLFELGGKRGKREALASTEKDLVLWDYESKRMDVIYQVAVRYIKILSTQARVKLAAKTMIVAEQIHKTVVTRVEAGLVSPLEQSKSRVELANTRLRNAKVLRQQISNKQNMSALWGSVAPIFDLMSGNIFSVQAIPEFPVLLAKLQNNPDLARWTAEIERYRNAINLAKSKKIPDITFMAGGRHFAENGDIAVVAGLSIPLFLFDTKQTGVDEAELILAQALQKQQKVKVAIQSSLVNHYQQLQLSFVEINAYRDEVLPSAQAAFKASKLAFRLGEIGSLGLLDAQRTLFKSERQFLDASANFKLNVTKIERLIGGALHASAEKENEINK